MRKRLTKQSQMSETGLCECKLSAQQQLLKAC